MNKRKTPVAHIFMEEGGMVTKTDDIELARKLMNEKLVHEGWHTEEEVAAGETFAFAEPVIEVGRVVPAPPDDEYVWYWRQVREGGLGDRGVTRAVVWH